MDKGLPSSLFVNDGSFMERFKQLQQEKEKQAPQEEAKPKPNHLGSSVSNSVGGKNGLGSGPGSVGKASVSGSGGKLAFSLKQKSKVVAPSVKLSEDEEEDERGAGDAPVTGSAKRQKLCQQDTSEYSTERVDVAYISIPYRHWWKEILNERFGKSGTAPPPPRDPTVKNIADKLASFVAKNGRQIEHITRQKNPGDTPFKFLFDVSCAEYKYYEYRLQEEEKALEQTRASQNVKNGGNSSSTASSSQRSYKHRPNYQTPAAALYNVSEVQSEAGRSGESSVPTDPLAMMEYYAKKAAEEERKRRPKQSHDEMPPPASLQASAKRGHHMGDFIPPEELEKFLASCNDAAAQKAAKEAAEKARIQADNIGHKLLSKMGWKEGEGVGGSRKGIANPIMAGEVKTNNLGVGAHKPGEVTPDDDIYEQYKKRMMLGYRYRPNPLGNPRKAYY